MHVRIELLLFRYVSHNVTRGLECVTKMKQLLEILQQQRKLDINQTILVHDIGEYGTGRCQEDSKKCYEEIMTVLTELRKIGLKGVSLQARKR